MVWQIQLAHSFRATNPGCFSGKFEILSFDISFINRDHVIRHVSVTSYSRMFAQVEQRDDCSVARAGSICEWNPLKRR